MYDQKISRENPILIIILVDQSESMEAEFFNDGNKKYTVADIAKHVIDKFLFQALRYCQNKKEIRDYIQIAIIGYNTSIKSALPKIALEEFPIGASRLKNSFIKKNEYFSPCTPPQPSQFSLFDFRESVSDF